MTDRHQRREDGGMTEPATDEEIEQLRALATYGSAYWCAAESVRADSARLIARIDAERARADRYETDYGNALTAAHEHADYTHKIIAERDALAGRVRELEAEVARLWEAAAPFADWARWELRNRLPAAILEDPGTPIYGDAYEGQPEVCVRDFQRIAALTKEPFNAKV